MLTHAAHTSYMFELATETEAASVFSPVSPFRWKTMILSFSFFSRLHISPDHSTRYFFLIIMSSPPIRAFISFRCQ